MTLCSYVTDYQFQKYYKCPVIANVAKQSFGLMKEILNTFHQSERLRDCVRNDNHLHSLSNCTKLV